MIYTIMHIIYKDIMYITNNISYKCIYTHICIHIYSIGMLVVIESNN